MKITGNQKHQAIIKHSNAGMGIMEVLVAIGLFAILAVGIASFMTNGMKQQKGIQAKDQQRDMSAKIRSLLNDKTACLNSFGAVTPVVGDPPTAPTVTSINDKFNTATFSIGDTDQTKLLQIEKIRLSNWVPEAGNPAQGSLDLLINFSKTTDTGTSKFIAPDTITLRAKRIVGGKITECFSIGVQSGGFWQASPFNTSNIYYSGGNVGIGTDTPIARLHVVNDATIQVGRFEGGNADSTNIWITNSAVGGRAFTMGATGNANVNGGGNFLISDATAGGTVRLAIDQSGNVGIGTISPAAKLDVAGEIKLASTGAPCNLANEGSLRYNSTAGIKKMEYCDGSGSWSKLGGIKTKVVIGPFVNGPGNSLTCPAGWLMSSCRAQISTSDGQSLHIRNEFSIIYDSNSNPIGCTSGAGMCDGNGCPPPGADQFAIVLACVQ